MRTPPYRILCRATAVVAAVLVPLLVAGLRTPVTSAVLTTSPILVVVWCVAGARPRRP